MSSHDQTSPVDEPAVLLCFAGPNGSGKSTVTQAVLSNPALFSGQYINADEIAKGLEKQIPDYYERNMKAAAIAEQQRLAAIQAGKSFAFETVMSTPEKIALMTQAKASGYEVSLVFVTTNNPELNVRRVAERVAQGGHDVDPDKIRSRYNATMHLLACAIDHADDAQVFDNSFEKPISVVEKSEKELVLHNPSQHGAWVKEKLIAPYQERLESRRAISAAFDADSQKNPAIKAVLRDADASHGKAYSGIVVEQTKHHTLQKVGANVYVVHDRSLHVSPAVEKGKQVTIQYAYDKGRVVAPAPQQRTTQKGIER